MLFMKRVLLLITILFVSVISTACINNLAVQELNNKAKEYMANGEVEKAICRLRSSIDLDTSIFETHYNLGVALIEVKEYKEAQVSLENAIKLNPDFVDTYYSLAVAYENEADAIVNEKDDTESDDNAKLGKDLSANEKLAVVELYNLALDNYNKYLAKVNNTDEKEKLSEHINFLNQEIAKYNSLKSDNEDLSSVKSSGEF